MCILVDIIEFEMSRIFDFKCLEFLFSQSCDKTLSIFTHILLEYSDSFITIKGDTMPYLEYNGRRIIKVKSNTISCIGCVLNSESNILGCELLEVMNNPKLDLCFGYGEYFHFRYEDEL